MARIHTTFGNEIHKKQVEIIDLPLLPSLWQLPKRINSIVRSIAVPEIGFWIHSEPLISPGSLRHKSGNSFSYVCFCCMWRKTDERDSAETVWRARLRNLVFEKRVLFLCKQAGIKRLVFRKGFGFGSDGGFMRGEECQRFYGYAPEVLEDLKHPRERVHELFKHFTP
jgi:hypothetical protein